MLLSAHHSTVTRNQQKEPSVMSICSTLKSTPLFLAISLFAMLIIFPLPGLAQEERAAEKAAVQKAKEETPAKQQPSPQTGTPDPTKKPEDDKKPEDENKPKDPMSSPTFSGLHLRAIGPAFTSGRVIGFAVDPENSQRYFVAAASGGVWRTTNNGTSWTPVFDTQGSYSIGTVVIHPKNPSVVWVGTGENNDQRSVSYGDGVYKSEDGGKTWRNVGLKQSEHIAHIVIDPRDSNVVYVAAPGPLWKGGGDRGLYKSTDGGKNWTSLIKVGEYTGVADVILDPRN